MVKRCVGNKTFRTNIKLLVMTILYINTRLYSSLRAHIVERVGTTLPSPVAIKRVLLTGLS